MDVITSLQNDRVKLTYNLQTRPRARRKERKIALEGVRLIRDAILSKQRPLFVFYQAGHADYDFVAWLQERKIEAVAVNAEVMRHISDAQNPQGIVGVFPLPVPPLPRKPTAVLILDSIRDPGNLGTMLRTAGAAGVDCVLLAADCADPYNPKALRSGMGAHFRVPVVESGWQEISAYCEPLTVYLAAGDGDVQYDQVDWTDGWALIIGSEAHGASDNAKNAAAHHIVIPMAAGTESLNAAVAAGVVLFEAARQRR